jgi:hypothetical protein
MAKWKLIYKSETRPATKANFQFSTRAEAEQWASDFGVIVIRIYEEEGR